MKVACSVILALTALLGVAGPRNRNDVPCIDLVSIAKQKGHPSIAGMKSIADQVTTAVRK